MAEVVVAPPKPAPIPKEFPQPREISVGAERDNIAERFGQPALATTTTSDDGRVMETLVDARKSGRDVTVIGLRTAKVLSAIRDKDGRTRRGTLQVRTYRKITGDAKRKPIRSTNDRRFVPP